MFCEKVQLDNSILAVDGLQWALSLAPLTHYLQLKTAAAPAQRTIPHFVLQTLAELEQQHGPLDEDNVGQYASLFDSVRVLSQRVSDDSDDRWAIGTPLADKALYGTLPFKERACSPHRRYHDSFQHGYDLDFENRSLYLLVLERLYGLPNPSLRTLYTFEQDGVTQYLELEIDYSFVEVAPLGALPYLDMSAFRDKEISSLEDLKPLLDLLDPRQFSFRGFSILRFVKRNKELITERFQTLIGNLHHYELPHFFAQLQDLLATALGSRETHSSFFPVLELNGFPVLKTDFSKDSIFFSDLIARERERCASGIFEFIKKPHTLSYGIEAGLDTLEPVLVDLLKSADLSSYLCIPLKHNKTLVGFLELYTRGARPMDRYTLLSIKPFFPYLAQIAYELLIIFKQRLDQVILKNYTALQPAVQWRFNQVAASYLGKVSAGHAEALLEQVVFADVYPVYGAVDIKDSTKWRNTVQREEGIKKIAALEGLVSLLAQQAAYEDRGLSAKVRQVGEWLASSHVDRHLSDIQYFFYQELPRYINDVRALLAVDEATLADVGLMRQGQHYAFGNRSDAFEISLQTLNRMIKGELDKLNDYVQRLFPSYFETFRTDGIEYDMYVGQSITPTEVFDASLLRLVRKQQILTMAHIAKKAREMRRGLPVPLQTTQLIFVHPHEIDISFRLDEKRFDVDGGYNVRYQVIKKRIDKVLVQDSHERLVQPDSIAIVYSSPAIEAELQESVRELIDMGVISPQVEYLALEEIQDVIELRALRLYVTTD